MGGLWGRRWRSGENELKGGMREVIYRWWVWFALALVSHGKIYFRRRMEGSREGWILHRLFHCLRPLPGLLRCTEPFSFHCTVGPPDTAVLRAPGTPPLACSSPSPVSVLPLFALQSLKLLLCLSSWDIPSQQGGLAGWAAIGLNAGQHG